MEQKTEIPYLSDLWEKEHIGRFTASQFFRLMTDPKSKSDKEAGNLSETAKSYVLEKVAESMDGYRVSFTSDATVYGVQLEPKARAVYEIETGLEVSEVGFLKHDKYDFVGCTPDGMIGTIGGIEIKCPFETKNYLKLVMTKDQDQLREEHKDYYWQCVGGLFVTGAEWWDLVAFDPSHYDELGLKVIRVLPIKEEMELLEQRLIRAFEYKKEIESMIASMKQ